METIDITLPSLLISFLLLIIPVILSIYFRLQMLRQLFVSVFRMSLQLVLIGIFLKYLFSWNNDLINLAWLSIMILVAVFSAVKGSSMKLSTFLVPTFFSFSSATLFILLFLNTFVIKLHYVLDAKYLIVLGGMLLGNSLRGNIVGITSFYKSIKKNSREYLYVLSLGATHHEALLPYLQDSIHLALQPTLASMATMGIVALPGMMTGVILGGTSPLIAIKYQIMIMIAILVSTITSVVLTILMSLPLCFNGHGILKEEVFISKKGPAPD